MFTYTRSQLKSDINTGLKGKIGMIANPNDFLNRVVRETKNAVVIRSSKRKQQLTPDLVRGQFEYVCASDLQDNRIIDIPAQAKRYDGSFGLVPVEQFNTDKKLGDIAIDSYNGVRTLLINSEITTQGVTVEPTSALGSWVLFGDGENVALDNDDYILGNGSISFDISSAGGTTAGVQNSSLDSFDISDYLGGTSALYVWVKINSATNLTNFIMRLGSDSSNYYSKTVTAKSDGNAFERGWNLLRFDLTSLAEAGSVTDTGITYLAIYMTKTIGKISETDYKINYPVIRRGVIHNVSYYSKYGWQTSAGVWLQNSTDDSDVLVADDTEYELFVKKGIEIGLPLVNANDEEPAAKTAFSDAVFNYAAQNPDESQIMVSTYHQQ